ncbi:MAG: efflux RND transporter periplasmic adaptor subunit [Candidatus Cyclobacteriaceae bacterium M3_2C_046]
MRHIFITILSIAAFSCNRQAEDHGHAHDEFGSHGEETLTQDTTLWTGETELFVEFPALVAGRSSRFAVHFTKLEGHQPVREGSVTVSLIKDQKGIKHKVEAPSFPGIFSPALQPKEAGEYQLVFDLETPEYQDRIIVNNVRVFASAEEAEKGLGTEEEDDGTITFLKEQAWKIDFQTVLVIRGEIYDVINTSGVWKASPGGSKTLIASAGGVIGYVDANLTKGTIVKKGQPLMTISGSGLTSNNLSAEIEQARANFEQAKAEYERKKQLNELDIVPNAELEQVESRFKVAKSTYETLSSGYSAGGKQIRAPFDGYIKAINVNNGDFVNQGDNLITIGSHQSRLLEAHVNLSQAAGMENIHNIWYQPDYGRWSDLNGAGGTLLSVGKEVDPGQPQLPVYARVNEVVTAPEGSFTEVQIAVGDQREGLIIPASALLEDYGKYEAVVQLSGESFERRPVIKGRQNGEQVEIIKGLNPGEVVVSEGAYQVKMASMAGQVPAHGHTH